MLYICATNLRTSTPYGKSYMHQCHVMINNIFLLFTEDCCKCHPKMWLWLKRLARKVQFRYSHMQLQHKIYYANDEDFALVPFPIHFPQDMYSILIPSMDDHAFNLTAVTEKFTPILRPHIAQSPKCLKDLVLSKLQDIDARHYAKFYVYVKNNCQLKISDEALKDIINSIKDGGEQQCVPSTNLPRTNLPLTCNNIHVNNICRPCGSMSYSEEKKWMCEVGDNLMTHYHLIAKHPHFSLCDEIRKDWGLPHNIAKVTNELTQTMYITGTSWNQRQQTFQPSHQLPFVAPNTYNTSMFLVSGNPVQMPGYDNTATSTYCSDVMPGPVDGNSFTQNPSYHTNMPMTTSPMYNQHLLHRPLLSSNYVPSTCTYTTNIFPVQPTSIMSTTSYNTGFGHGQTVNTMANYSNDVIHQQGYNASGIPSRHNTTTQLHAGMYKNNIIVPITTYTNNYLSSISTISRGQMQPCVNSTSSTQKF